ncbi:MAG: hypothetical protein AAF986_02245 [Pseudomonadota bacterium]
MVTVRDRGMKDGGMKDGGAKGRGLFVLYGVLILAVVANFARTAPLDFKTPPVSGIENATYGASTPTDLGAGDAEQDGTARKCPCPTEIENADCDEGICAVGLLIEDYTEYAHASAPKHLTRTRLGQGGHRKPPTAPPRQVG